MSPSDTHDVHTLTGAYATDALPEAERRAFEEHLGDCPSCRQEVAGLVATAARLGVAAAAPAPPAMRERVLSQISTVRQVSPVVARLEDVRADIPWFRQPLAVAASFLLVLTIGLGVFAATERQRANDAEQTAARITAVVMDPDRREATQPVSSGGSGTVVMADDRAVFHAAGLPELPSDRAYQLWRIDKAGAHSLGVLGRGGDRSLQQFVEHVDSADKLGLTVEPSAGSKAPTTTPVLILPMPA
jgi:anti-sigma-K factor RskA